MARANLVFSHRRPSWYFSFEVVVLMLTVSFIAGLFTGAGIVELSQ